MSRGLVCDQCGDVLTLNARGEHDGGEDAAWIKIHIAHRDFDVCSRSCAHELLDREDVVAAHDAWLETIADIAHSIAEAREEGGDDDDA